MKKKTFKQSELVAAMGLLYEFMQGLDDTELVIGDNCLKICLPGCDEISTDKPRDLVVGVNALKTLQSLRDGAEASDVGYAVAS